VVAGGGKEDLQFAGAIVLFLNLAIELSAFQIVDEALGNLPLDSVLLVPNGAHAGELCLRGTLDIEYNFARTPAPGLLFLCFLRTYLGVLYLL